MSLERASTGEVRPRFPASCDARLKLCVALVAWLVVLSADRARAALVIGGAAWLSLLALGTARSQAWRALRAALFTGGVAVLLRLVLTGGEPGFVWHVLGHELIITRADGTKLNDVRLAFFGVGATPVRARGAEAALAAGDLDAGVAALALDLDPPDDVQAEGRVKKHLAGVLLRRCARQLSEAPQ